MARQIDRERAIALRLKGMSYSQIREEIGVGKGTLSVWLRQYPLSERRIRELRDWNQRRIEQFRQTMSKKREARLAEVARKERQKVGKLSRREIFLSGLFLYWAEGSKTLRYTIALTNTDPMMLRFFIVWLGLFGISKRQLRARLHIYSDMDEMTQKKFWVTELGIPAKNFKGVYIKAARASKRVNYKGRFGHGTCSLVVHGRDICERVLAGVEVLRQEFSN